MSDPNPIITIEDGQLQGSTKIDWLGGKNYSFQGIPYAKPPIGSLRFKAPQPVEPWTGIRDASKEGNVCFHKNALTQQIIGSEDCLFLNVYTPQLPSGKEQPKAVMVWIHGGAFINGSGNCDLHGPDFLVAEDVVVVTMNYRLGLLGFACFANESLDVPGNAGFKDQVLALKWVQKNISKFGGDPNNVTIFGASAGSVSVHLMLLSPLAKGLFHRAICQSGVSTAGWTNGKLTAPLVAKVLALEEANEDKIFKILNDLPSEKLFDIEQKLPGYSILSQHRVIGVVVELYKNESTFLHRPPQDILISGDYSQVPLMIGYTSREGMIMQLLHNLGFGEIKWISDYEDEVPSELRCEKDSQLLKNIAERIKDFYYGNETSSLENIDRFYLLYSDIYFFVSINNAVMVHTTTSSSPTYYYRMSLDTHLNTIKQLGKIYNAGTAHGDDMGYLFKTIVTPDIRPKTPEDVGLRRVLKLWTTFAKNGNPNPIEQDKLINVTWPPTEDNKLHYIDIGENLTIGVNPESERVEFWKEIQFLCSSQANL